MYIASDCDRRMDELNFLKSTKCEKHTREIMRPCAYERKDIGQLISSHILYLTLR